MKKYLLALLAVLPILTACPPKEVLPTSVTRVVVQGAKMSRPLIRFLLKWMASIMTLALS